MIVMKMITIIIITVIITVVTGQSQANHDQIRVNFNARPGMLLHPFVPIVDRNDGDYGIINGTIVPRSDSMIKSTFKASYKSDGIEKRCTVNFAEKSHLLVTAAHCCTKFITGPNLRLSNSYRNFTVDVYAALWPETFKIKEKENDVCMVVLNRAITNVQPLTLAFTASNVNDTISIYGYGWYKANSRTSKVLRTGTVKMTKRQNFSAIRVSALSAQMWPGDSGGSSFNNGNFFGVIQGSDSSTVCSMENLGAISEFQPLEKFLTDIVKQYPDPPNKSNLIHSVKYTTFD